MALALQTFTLTPEQLKACAEKMLAEHQISIDVSQPFGVIESHGAVIDWSYVAPTLTVQCIKKPWIYPEAAVISGIAGFFKTDI